ncbi:hypothetical protein QJQ45_004676 [Haematococcus lacustris]|nr:hypothetical protein QJQ45_004678 [Haematococcus lacustris]KAJ9507045.1 hypothetical protein QJQ45_004676 [Haematococcus lacustris]
MATRSRIRGLMCSTSNVIKRRFYDRDVSAALNIARIAAGPGRPRELNSWLGRPAMPNPGRVGQEWVQRIGESMQRPLELCSYDGLKALPPVGKEYQGYKQVNGRLPKGRQRLHRAAEYHRGIDGRARINA